MCELFAMSSRFPTTVSVSMQRLASHGSRSGRLADGWGIAFYDGNDVRLLREPEPVAGSPWVHFIAGRRVYSRIVLSHIRHATQGDIALANTQPFARELGGRVHMFAHNGMLPGVERRFGGEARRYRPIGTTDSEVAFCVLLDRLMPLWNAGMPSARERRAVVAEFADELRALGPANFIYADGELLFAHGDRRTQADGSIAPPGLTMLVRECTVDRDMLPDAGVAVPPQPGPQVLTLFASIPLTDEKWQALDEGELVVVDAGEVIAAG